MDFFEHQERARKKTGRLVFLFAMAVAAIVLGVYLLVKALSAWMFGNNLDDTWWDVFWRWDLRLFMTALTGTLLVVTSGTLYKILQLRSGGSAVALSLGARMVDRSTKDPGERRLLNVVEEMSIASGTRTPPVYVLSRERGINAFAAGYRPDDAVIGVTRGCTERLTRPEIQGVIAHEFSHILNGDMRLNVNLMGLLHGILVIGLIGESLLRGSGSRSSKKSGKDDNALVWVGVALMVIGYSGVLCGKLIKAAVSRQREFLADASAVQFTRHPDGLAGALKKIGAAGSLVQDPKSQTISHMFFSQSFKSRMAGLLATHPQLEERIRRIEPTFSGRFPKAEGAPSPLAASSVSAAASSDLAAAPSAAAVASIGHPTTAHLQRARALLEGIPRRVRDAAQGPYGSRALVYGLLLSREEGVRKIQVERLAKKADSEVYFETLSLQPELAPLGASQRLALVSLALPNLADLSSRQYSSFKSNVLSLLENGEKTGVFDWLLRRALLKGLEPQFEESRRKEAKPSSLEKAGRRVLAASFGALTGIEPKPGGGHVRLPAGGRRTRVERTQPAPARSMPAARSGRRPGPSGRDPSS